MPQIELLNSRLDSLEKYRDTVSNFLRTRVLCSFISVSRIFSYHRPAFVPASTALTAFFRTAKLSTVSLQSSQVRFI